MFDVSGSFWLTPGEQQEAIGQLLEGNLLKWDNTGALSLPLKNTGMTDIYVNMRDARSCPPVMRYLADIYTNTMRRLRVQRIMEIPDGISPMAALVSEMTGIPMVTVRPEAKPGRVVSGKLIGNLNYGELVAPMDDVVTDAGSKIPALVEARNHGARVASVVALVDRQGGWQKQLAEAGFGGTPFWFGMTLHDIRRFLIGHGLMQRCDPNIEAKNPIIVALDGKDWDDLVPLLVRLRASGCILKVNDLLSNEGIKRLLPDLSVYGRVMADIKGHDIPNTLANITRHFGACPPWAITVHASGGVEMVRATRAKLDEVGAKSTKVLAVTVLTSIDQKTCEEIYVRQPLPQVLKLAEVVSQFADGFVCSPEEVGELSKLYPGKIFANAGVRSPGENLGDQKRVATPKEARDNGATNLVMGRQVLGAKDPVAEVKRVMKDELGIEI
jgi:orotidine-5'-phosphate decarboxylase